MKKKLLIACFLFSVSHAQSQEHVLVDHNKEASFQTNLNTAAEAAPQTGKTRHFAETKAMWDMQLSINATAGTNAGMAGVAYVGGVFVVSKWATDSIFVFSSTGVLQQELTISGLSGTRAITTDGTFMYVSNNTDMIYRVSPVTLQLAPPHISTSLTSVRWATYDATLDGGAGGFWVGNFNTAISAISMSGALLSTIPQATHTLGGMYGVAVDNVSAGGPYLWVSHQEGTNQTQLTAVEIATGLPTVHTHDVLPDVSATHGLSTGLAGGVFFTSDLVQGENSLVGLLQGNPDNILFAYEVNLSSTSEFDLAASSIRPTEGYTQVPLDQTFSETWDFNFSNNSTASIDTVYADLQFYHNGVEIASETVYTTPVASGAQGTFTSSAAPFSNGLGDYTMKATLRTSLEAVDMDDTNDTISFAVSVTPNKFARDNGVADGSPGYSISTVNWGYASTLYEVKQPTFLTEIEIEIATPIQDDTTYAMVFDYNGSTPGNLLATGHVTLINASQNLYTLTFPLPVYLAAGTYAFGCYEGAGTSINLAQSSSLYTLGTNFYYVAGTGWVTSNIPSARFIRPVVETTVPSGINENLSLLLKAYPNPAESTLTLSLSEVSEQGGELTFYDMSGRVVLNESMPKGTTFMQVDVSAMDAGIYMVSYTSPKRNVTSKVIVR